MTMQVAMVGTDGTVLASDRQVVSTQHHIWQTYLTRKIRVNQQSDVAVAYARNQLGGEAANRILEKLTADNIGRWHSELRGIGYAVYNDDLEEAETAEVLVVSPRRPDTIYYLTVGKGGDCCEVLTKKATGDSNNSAVFFAERYYDGGRPIAQLAFLAAHTILTGSILNPAGIKGLDLLFCRPSGFTWATAAELRGYERRSRELGEQFERTLWSGIAEL
ncbi:MAG: hypothetical protein WCC87_14455 [Candidatus Korobacteraceae bacterium]